MAEEFVHYVEFYDTVQLNQDRYVWLLEHMTARIAGHPKVLDVAGGTGNLAKALLEAGHEVAITDFSEDAVAASLRKLSEYENFQGGFVSDARALCVSDNSYDAVTLTLGVPPVISEDPLSLNEIFRILRPGGKLGLHSWAPVEDLWEGAYGVPKREFIEKELSPEIMAQWDAAAKQTRPNIDLVRRNAVPLDVITEQLTEIGFRDINVFPNHPYEHYAHIIDCVK